MIVKHHCQITSSMLPYSALHRLKKQFIKHQTPKDCDFDFTKHMGPMYIAMHEDTYMHSAILLHGEVFLHSIRCRNYLFLCIGSVLFAVGYIQCKHVIMAHCLGSVSITFHFTCFVLFFFSHKLTIHMNRLERIRDITNVNDVHVYSHLLVFVR